MLEPRIDEAWTVRDKLRIVSGATNGIGKQTALGLASQGARVVVVARSRAKGDATVREVGEAISDGSVELLLCDFASQRSIRAAAEEALARFLAIHVLVNKAGVMILRREVTEDGLEATFAVNHLGYFLFTTLEALVKDPVAKSRAADYPYATRQFAVAPTGRREVM